MNITMQDSFIECCTSCGACMSICPVDAIDIIENSEGFLYPSVDSNKCLNCGACLKVCSIGKIMTPIEPLTTKAGYAQSEVVRKQSSSGGIFALVSEEVLKEGGVIYGVVFEGNEHKAFYDCTDNISLESLMKSKYVEAYDPTGFKKVKEDLDSGRKVLYSGTPCKVAALKKYLRNDYPNLFTIDFKCHGRPSPRLLMDVIKEEEHISGKNCIGVTFREKIKGWRHLVIAFYFDNGGKVVYDASHYYYYYYFLHNYSLRKSCFTCEYYHCHASDLTLADYWNAPKDIDDDLGISAVFVNTCKGVEMLNSISDKMVFVKDNNILPSSVFAHSKEKGYNMKKRDRFFDDYKKRGIAFIRESKYKNILRIEGIRLAILRTVVRLKKTLKL